MSELPPARPKRRPRYAGRNPRRFEQKYKEHDPERYGEDVAKVIASGKTPAGMHRPIMVREILDALQPKAGDVGVDATLGYGGHALDLLRAIEPTGRLLALDVDPIELPKAEGRLRAAGYGPEVLSVTRANFAGLPQALAAAGIGAANFVLADLGLSSMQIDNPTRGFTFKWPGPFDLRLNPERGRPAAEFVAGLSIEKLAAILQENADEPNASRLAAALHTAARQGELATTVGVAKVIRNCLEGSVPSPDSSGKKPRALPRPRPETEAAIRRVFQAVRIAINDEFGALETFLRVLPTCLKPGGRVAVLTFHSGEDRRVKLAFRQGLNLGVYRQVTEEVIRPGSEEIRSNPRATSAKLRWAERSTADLVAFGMITGNLRAAHDV